MPNTIQTSINYVQGALGYWTPTVGTSSEPAITAANMTKQIMLAAPFKWPWNRNKTNFAVSSGTQDYTVSVTDFGYLERAVIKNTATGKYHEIPVFNHNPLGETGDSQQPINISVQDSTPGTNITVRFAGLPDQSYTCYLTYQSFAALMANTSAQWSPIPDYMSYIYNRGFLAFLFEAMPDPARAQQEKVAFAASLLSTSTGLTESEKNIFLSGFLQNDAMRLASQLKTQQGITARGM